MNARKMFTIVLTAGLLLALSPAAQATIITTTDATVDSSNTDLLQTNLDSVSFIGDFTQEGSLGVTALTNGTATYSTSGQGSPNYNQDRATEVAKALNDTSVTYTLDGGYDLTQIDIYHGWQDNGRDRGQVAVEYAVVGDEANFITIVPTTTYDPASNYGRISLTDLDALNVKVINIEFPGAQENNGGGYSEIDVFGTPAATEPEPELESFVAYHDLGATTGQESTGNITTHQSGGSGTSTNPLNTATIDLINYADGTDTGIDFSIAGANAMDSRTGVTGPPAGGTDADALFNVAGLNLNNGLIYEGGGGGSGSTTFTFAGLDPDMLYDIALYGDRTAGADGVERFTLIGADGATNTSSTGIIDPFTTDMQTRPNATDGYVVRWSDIEAGDDGIITIDIDPEVTSANNIAYLSAVRVEGVSLLEPEPDPEPVTELGILDLDANGGINPATGLPWEVGDTYRFAFTSSELSAATSTDITTYNAFVQGLADAAGLGGATWNVIASTEDVDARDNTSTNIALDGTGEAIFLLDGTTVVAVDYADLWGSDTHDNAINKTELLTTPYNTDYGSTWTGTYRNAYPDANYGTQDATGELGDPDGTAMRGLWPYTSGTHWIWRWSGDTAEELPIYALSDPLILTGGGEPEPEPALVGELGILDEAWFAANPINPDTGAPWEAGDTYHLLFATEATTVASINPPRSPLR